MIRLALALSMMFSLMVSPLASASDADCLNARLGMAGLQQDAASPSGHDAESAAFEAATPQDVSFHNKNGDESKSGQHCCCLHAALSSALPEMDFASPRHVEREHKAQDGASILHEPLSRPPFHI